MAKKSQFIEHIFSKMKLGMWSVHFYQGTHVDIVKQLGIKHTLLVDVHLVTKNIINKFNKQQW